MPTLFFFQEVATQSNWLVIVLAFVVSLCSNVATALLTYFLSRPRNVADIHKTNAESRKTNVDAALAVLDKLPSFLQQLELAHAKSMDDETEKEHLQREIERCREGCRDARLST